MELLAFETFTEPPFLPFTFGEVKPEIDEATPEIEPIEFTALEMIPELVTRVVFNNVTVARKTPKAITCLILGRYYSIPDSQLSVDSEVRNLGDVGTLVVDRWWAMRARLI